MLGAADEDLWMQTDLAQLRDALLRWLGLQLARGLDERHEGHVHDDDILRADFEDELPNRLEERQPFDVTCGAADLCDDHIARLLVSELAEPRLDLIRDVGDDLHRLAEVITTPLAPRTVS
jgi:hypothetical protein